MSILDTRVLIVGAGAVGTFVGSRILEKGVDVTFLTGEVRAEQIVCQGLRLYSPFGRFKKPVRACVPGQIDRAVDLIVLAPRAHHLFDAASIVAPALGPRTIVLSLSDGGPFDDFLRRKFPDNKVYSGNFMGRVAIDADGYLSHRLPAAHVAIGDVAGTGKTGERIAELLSGRGLTAAVVSDIERRIWERSIYLAAAVATTLERGVPLRDALRTVPGGQAFSMAIADGRSIAHRARVETDAKLARWCREALTMEGVPLMAPSRVDDRGGAGLEAQFLLGAMVERGQRLGQPPGILARTYDRLRPANQPDKANAA